MADPRSTGNGRRYLDAVGLVFLFAFVVLATPVVYLWARPGAPWYLPYLLWLAIIFLAFLVQRLRTRREL